MRWDFFPWQRQVFYSQGYKLMGSFPSPPNIKTNNADGCVLRPAGPAVSVRDARPRTAPARLLASCEEGTWDTRGIRAEPGELQSQPSCAVSSQGAAKPDGARPAALGWTERTAASWAPLPRVGWLLTGTALC